MRAPLTLFLAAWTPVSAAVPAFPSPPEQGPAWQWPVTGRPAVLERLDPDAGRYGPGHRGADLAAAPGTVVHAAGAGVVAFAGPVAGRGVVSVDHAGGLRTTYEPLDPLVTAGQPVARGQPLGVLTVGHCLPGSCLHWGLRRGETYLDPLALVGSAPVRLLPVWGQP